MKGLHCKVVPAPMTISFSTGNLHSGHRVILLAFGETLG